MDILQFVSRETSDEITHDLNAMTLEGTHPLQETPRTKAAMCHLEGFSVDSLQTHLHLAESDLSQFFCTSKINVLGVQFRMKTEPPFATYLTRKITEFLQPWTPCKTWI